MGELKNRERLNITLSKDMAARLRAHCKELGYDISGLIESCLRNYFAEPDSIMYEVFADTITVPISTNKTTWTAHEIEALYFAQQEQDEASLGVFQTLEAARAWFDQCKPKQHTGIMAGYPNGKLLRANVLFIQQGVYTSELENVTAGDVVNFYAEPLV